MRWTYATLLSAAACSPSPDPGFGATTLSGSETSTTSTGSSGESTESTETTTETETGDTSESETDTTGDETTGGAEGPVVLVSGEPGARGIAVDATHVYWTNQTTGTIGRVPIAGGDPEWIATDQVSPYAIAVDDTHAYWSDQGGDAIMRTVKDGSESPTQVAVAYDPTAIAIDGTHVYWAGSLGIYRTLKQDPIDEEWLAQNEEKIGGLTVNSSHVYWTDHGGWDEVGDTGNFVPMEDMDPYLEGRVMRVAKGGGSAQVVVGAQEYPFGVDLDSQHVYWANGTAAGDEYTEINKIKRAPSGGGADEDLATMQEEPWSIVVLGDWVYYGTKTAISRVPREGGAPELLADMQWLPRYLAVDNAHVFWANGDGTIMKLAFE
jgi:hypothetical protein